LPHGHKIAAATPVKGRIKKGPTSNVPFSGFLTNSPSDFCLQHPLSNPAARQLEEDFLAEAHQQQWSSFCKVAAENGCDGVTELVAFPDPLLFLSSGSSMPYVLAVPLYDIREFNSNFRKLSVFPCAIAQTSLTPQTYVFNIWVFKF
jgi:hypothetical protein